MADTVNLILYFIYNYYKLSVLTFEIENRKFESFRKINEQTTKVSTVKKLSLILCFLQTILPK